VHRTIHPTVFFERVTTVTFVSRPVLIASALIAMVGLSGCGADDETAVTVSLRASACVKVPAKCYELGLPEARVEILDGGGSSLASGATDAVGNVTLNPSESGSVRIVVTSPLFVGGRKEVTTQLAPGSKTDQSIWVELDVSALAPQ
jgi:hypothetical protein